MSKVILPRGLQQLLRVGSRSERSHDFIDGIAETLVRYARDYSDYKQFQEDYHKDNPGGIERQKVSCSEVVAHETYLLQMRSVAAMLLQAAIQLDLEQYNLSRELIRDAQSLFESATARFKALKHERREFVLTDDDAFSMFAVLMYQLDQRQNQG